MTRVAELEAAPPMQPTYYVLHPDGTYTVAKPQPIIEFENPGPAETRCESAHARKIVEEGTEQDARRYRYARDCVYVGQHGELAIIPEHRHGYEPSKQALDAAIDNALAKEIEK